MYIRRKTIKGHIYYYLVEGRRVGGRVQQKVIRYLGKSAAGVSLGRGSGGIPPPAPHPLPPPFTGFPDITTPVVEELIGRHTVSKQYIADLTRSRGIRQAECDIITTVLAELPEEVPVQEFAEKVYAHLLPLTATPAPQSSEVVEGDFPNMYGYIVLPDQLRGQVNNYYERVYESPIPTSAGEVHFAGTRYNDPLDFEHYFAHTRIEDMADNETRRVIEVQSDLFQRGRLEEEDAFREREISNALTPTEREFLTNRARSASDLRDFFSDIPTETFNKLRKGVADAHLYEFIKGGFKNTSDGIEKLIPYRDSGYERIVGEEIKRAAQDGKTLLQFPTGETAMKIEGLGAQSRWYNPNAPDVGDLLPDQLKVGREVAQQGDRNRWIITDILGDGKFMAVPMNVIEMGEEELSALGYKYPDDVIAEIMNSPNGIEGTALSGSSVDTYRETFDITGKVDTNNPIYRFYEHRVQRCLKRIKSDMQRVTDGRGLTWFQVDLTRDDAVRPVAAFGVVRSPHGKS